MLPKFLLDEDDDWIEGFRQYWYPKLHPYLERVGGYGIGTSPDEQYVGYVDVDEEVIEQELVEIGFVRNPIACLKSTEDGRVSEGSWVLLAEDDVGEFIDDGYQLHVTMFGSGPEDAAAAGREFYAHCEPDWRVAPFKHLYPGRYPGAKYIQEPAAAYTRAVLDDHAFFTVKDESPAE